MKINEISENLERLGFKEEKKMAILALIDAKIENDMDKVINRMERVEERMESTLKTFIWVVSVAFGLVTILLTIIALKS